MAARLLFGASVAFVIFFMTEGGWRKGCVYTHLAGCNTPMNASFIVDGTNTVKWTLLTSTGTTLQLGTCYGTFNCSTSDTRISELRQSSSESVLTFSKNASSVRGELICEETLTNGTVRTDTWQLKITRILFGPQDDVHESKGLRVITSDTSPFTPSTVSWTLTTLSGQSLDLGTCTSGGTCTSPQSPDFPLLSTREVDKFFQNDVSFRHTDRSKAGRVFCSFTYNGSTETSNSTLNVYNPATVNNCHAQIRHQNWSTVLWCDVSDVFSSVGTYEFQVQFTKTGRHKPSGYVFDCRHSYRDMLTPYTDSTNKKLYYRGRLTYSWPLSPDPRSYSYLTVLLYYGSKVYTAEDADYRLNVSTPSQPTHNCSEMNYIPETGLVPCVCTADYLGSPPGRLVWLLGNITIETRDYGVTQLPFPSGKVSRQHDGMMVTCQLDWVQPINAAFTSYVAYGPDIVTLYVNTTRDVTNNFLVHVTSHVTGVKPMTSDMVQWGGLCQGQQGFTCTLTPNSTAEVDGKTVTCRVTNAANNGHSAEAAVVIAISGQPRDTATPSQPTNNCSELNYIPETGVVPCVCTADYLGSPAGRLVWLLGNINIATGDYGVTQLPFPSGKVSRQHDGMMVTCQLDWVRPISAAFTGHVAYGPLLVTLYQNTARDVTNNVVVHVTSHVTVMKPMTSDMVQWGGLCQGQQGFTCTLTPRSAAEVDGKTVTCRVTNAANNGHSAEASVVIRLRGTVISPDGPASKHIRLSKIHNFIQNEPNVPRTPRVFVVINTGCDELCWSGVVVGVISHIVLVIFIVLFVLTRRNQLLRRSEYNTPKQPLLTAVG